MVARRVTAASLMQTHSAVQQALMATRGQKFQDDETGEDELVELNLTCEQMADRYRKNCKSKTKASKSGVIHDGQICGMLRDANAVQLLKAEDYAGVDRHVFKFLSREK